MVYILVYGGLALPFRLINYKRTGYIKIPLIIVLWWLTWIKALLWLIWSSVESIFANGEWAFELAASHDQHASAIIGRNKDKTISHFLGVFIKRGLATKGMKRFCRALSWFDRSSDQHCIDSIGH